ncbi:hypothetical protein ACWGI0_25880 [Streptomyces sp. NPDC054802]
MLSSVASTESKTQEADTNQQLGMGDLRAEALFEPFLNIPRRDPQRGFRR